MADAGKSADISAGAAKPRGRPFKKGQSGNPGGRPRDTDEVRRGKEILRSAGPEAAEMLVSLMRAGNLQATESVLDRVYGKSATPIIAEISKTEEPLTLQEMLALAQEIVDGTQG